MSKKNTLLFFLSLLFSFAPIQGADYSVRSIPYNPVIPFPATEGTQILHCGDCFTNIPIGFTFNFYGIDYTNLFASSKAYLTFNFGSFDFVPDPIPTADLPPAILGFWRDLNPSLTTGSVYYTTLGDAPNRSLVVSYNNDNYWADKINFVTLQIVLYETTNLIEFYIQQWTAPTIVTQGVQNPPGNATAIPGRNDQLIPAFTGPEAWQFGILPSSPLNARGVQQINEFLSQKEYVNILTWESPLDSAEEIIAYDIYSDFNLTNLVATVPAAGDFNVYTQNNRLKNTTYTYFIVARGANGFLSSPTRVIINPLRRSCTKNLEVQP